MQPLRNVLLAEFIGTFALVAFGCGAVINYPAADDVLAVGFAFGLTIMVMVYAVGNVSGAHFNPAVSLAFFLKGSLPANRAVLYVAIQCAGAIAAALVLRALYPSSEVLGVTNPANGPWQSFFLEILLTFFLVFVILNVATGYKEKGIMAGAAIGLTITVCAVAGGPVSGASMNPARSLGPALVALDLASLWIYLVAPLLGGVVALALFKLTQTEPGPAEER